VHVIIYNPHKAHRNAQAYINLEGNSTYRINRL